MNAAVERFWRRAQNYLATEQIEAGRAALESLLVRDPTYIHAHLLLGGIAWKQDRMGEAVRHALDAARVVTDDGFSLLTVIRGLLHVGEFVAARQCLQRPFFARTGDAETLAQAAALSHLLGDHPASLALYERAHAAGMDTLEVRLDLATELSFNGRFKEAEAELEYCATKGATNGRVYVELARLRRQTPERNHLQLLERRFALAAPGSMDKAAIEFARYKELEDLGRHDEAWAALARGNALMAALTRYDSAREERLHDGLRAAFADVVTIDGSAREGPIPIFIIGMTRSGTTVLERILGNHSRVESAGELGDFVRQLRHVAGRCTQSMLDERILERLPSLDYAEVGTRYLAQTQWRANGRPFFVDKMPFNWLLAGPIRRALPQARILHLVRDPMDVCFSNLRAFFGDAHGWSYDQTRLVHYFRRYLQMMAHWHAVMPGQILDVGYTGLVRDPETMARRVFAFCGLDYEEGCLDLSRNQTAVATLSMAQVRGGIHARTSEEWRPYASHLEELRATAAA
ncbi:MAG TPA: sulfotransferase [Xanthomonadaceae bacterium]|nr:sulfotransferase [Xanthomonadaceae bacterium]